MTLVTIYGQTRILFAIGRDGMLRAFFEMVKRRTQTPVNNTIVVAIVVALLAGPLPIDFLAETTSVGTLVAFLVVSIGVIILRRTAPDLERGFRVPLYPVVPILSVLGCIWIIIGLNPITIAGFVIWGAVVLVWYCYGMSHARTGPAEGRPVTIVVGLPRDERAMAAMHLGALLTRSLDDSLVVCSVVPPPWPPGTGKVDAEYQEYLDASRPRRWPGPRAAGGVVRGAAAHPVDGGRRVAVVEDRAALAGALVVVPRGAAGVPAERAGQG